MSTNYERIERELVTDLEVTAAVRETESRSILAALEGAVSTSVENTGIPVTDVALVSGAIRPGNGERTALFNVTVDKGVFPVGVVYTIAGSEVDVKDVQYPELKKAHNFARYILEFGDEKFATEAKDKKTATSIIVDALLEQRGELSLADRRYTKVNASLLKEALEDTAQMVGDTGDAPEAADDDTTDEEPPALVSASVVPGFETNPLRSVLASRNVPEHELEKVATTAFEMDIDEEAGQIRVASLNRQASSHLQDALEAMGITGDVSATIGKVDADGNCTGVFNVEGDKMSGQFEFTAKEEGGIVNKVAFDNAVVSKFSDFREFQITLPESDRSFKVVASNERKACIELLEHLEKTEGTISFMGKVVTQSNREVIAEEMLEKCAIVERNVHTSHMDGTKDLGNWKLQHAGEGLVLVREE